jgi:hypothetical protein
MRYGLGLVSCSGSSTLIQIKQKDTKARAWTRRVSARLLVFVACCLAGTPALSQCDTWQGPANGGLWSVAANWTSGVPTSSTNVCIDNGNPQHSAVILNLGGAATGNLTINSDDSLSFNDNTNLTIFGSTITNAGNINLNSGGNNTDLILAGSDTVTLTGGGTVTLGSGSENNRIYSQSNGALINQETIQGMGQIGVGQTTITNSSLIDANVAGGILHINPGSGGVTNIGTLEATNGGRLDLSGGYTNTGGIISVSGSNSVVTLDNGSITGGTLTTTSGGTIESINSATLSGVTISTGSTYTEPDNTSATLAGTITNNGNIALNSGGNNTNLILSGNSTVTLTGTGTVTLGTGSGNNRIYSANNGTLVNQETIQGMGQLGVGQTTITNSSLIDANVTSGVLYVNPGAGGVTNTGTLEATNGGRLDLTGGYTNTGATIKATGTSSVVTLDNGSITGGTLTTASGGLVESINSATLSGVTISTGSTYADPDNTSTTLSGTITNNGNIALNSGGNNTNLILSGNSTVTLTGTGTVTLGNGSGNNRIYSATNGGTLINQETIQGIGQIGVGQTNITNTGTINANVAGVLFVNPGSGNGATNTGTLEATNGSRLDLAGTYTNTGGTISATGASSLVTLDNASITGGTLTSGTGGTIESLNSAILNGVTLSGGTSYVDPDNTTTTLQGTITNNGTISLNSGGNNTNLQISGPVTLTGSGTLNLGNNFNNRVYAPNGSDTLTIKQVVQGAGQLGVGLTTIVNNSTIDSNFTGSNLQIQTNSGGFNNSSATLEATNGATLTLYNSAFTNTGGTIEALNATTASTVVLNAATVNGGTLTTTGNGVIDDTNSTTLNGITVNAGSNVVIPDNNTTTWKGTITNNGTITDSSGGNNTNIQISGPVTLKGTGTLVFSNNGNNRLYAPNGTDTFTIQENIQGTGQLGVGLTKMVNSKTVNADNAGGTLTVQPNSAGLANNGGALESSNGGILNLVGNFTNNASGKIVALTGSTTQLNGANVKGGILTTVGTGVINVFNSSTLNALTVSTGSNVTMPDNNSTTFVGTITDNGTLSLSSGGNNTNLLLSGNVTLSGTGTLTMSNNFNNRIYDPSGTHTLTNGVIIQGSGQIGVGLMGLVNNGTIDANGSAGILLDTNGTGLTNNGTLQAGSGDLLHVEGGPFSNYSSGTLSGGTYISAGTLEIDEIGTTGGEITTLHGANVTLNGASASFIDGGGHSVINNLNTIDSTSSFSILGGFNFTTAGNFTNSGTLTVGSGSTFVVNGNLSNFSGTTLTGGTYDIGGTFQFNGANIVTDAANIALTSSTARIIDQHSNNGLANLATIATGGTFDVTGGANFTTAGNFTNNGTLEADVTNKFVVNGNLTNFSGTTLTGGSYIVGGTLQFNGANIVNNDASITLNGAAAKIVNQSGVNALTTFASNDASGSFTLTGNRTFTTAGAFTNAGIVDVTTGSTLTVGNRNNYTQTGGETIVDGKLTVASPGGLLFNGGSIFGNNGTFTGGLTDDAMFNVGDALQKPGKLTIAGPYTETSAGALNIDIGGRTVGTQYDQLRITGAATLGGTLNLDLINNFTPAIGNTFTIISFASETGTFANVNGTHINNNEHFVVNYNATNVMLSVASGPSFIGPLETFGSIPGKSTATPEPSSLVLVGAGVLAAAAALRRKLVG